MSSTYPNLTIRGASKHSSIASQSMKFKEDLIWISFLLIKKGVLCLNNLVAMLNLSEIKMIHQPLILLWLWEAKILTRVR
jgi:hypothetical protein